MSLPHFIVLRSIWNSEQNRLLLIYAIAISFQCMLSVSSNTSWPKSTFSIGNQEQNQQRQHQQKQKQSDLLFPSDAVKRYTHTEPGSHFGYSVAAYVGQAQSFCLVGAPKAKLDGFSDLTLSTFSPHKEDSTGLVYRLDLDKKLPYCSLVPIATTDEARKEYGTPTPGSKLTTNRMTFIYFANLRYLFLVFFKKYRAKRLYRVLEPIKHSRFQ